MESPRTSHEFLAHFDSPAAKPQPSGTAPQRGISWVLKWSGAFAVLIFAGGTLLQLTYCIAAEQKLYYAARSAALEATLPRASHETILATVQRRLADDSIPRDAVRMDIEVNGVPRTRAFRPVDDDCITVRLSVPAAAVLPAWLPRVSLRTDDSLIRAQAEQQMPGRFLKSAARSPQPQY